MKPIQLDSTNGLQFTAEETAGILQVLFRVGYEQPTENDRKLARDILLNAALTYPEYANYSKQNVKGVRPDLRSQPPFSRKRKR